MIRRILFSLILIVLGVMVGLLISEWGFRAAVKLGIVDANIFPFVEVDFNTIIHRYSDDIELIYECTPNATAEWNGVPVVINSAGFRDDEFALAANPERPRVAILGDSVAFGREVPVDQTFAHLLENLSRSEQSPLDVLNFGVVGYNSDQERRLLDTRVLAYSPRVVLLAYVMNDITPTDGIGVLVRAAHPAMLGRRIGSRLWIYLQDQTDRRRFWQASTLARPVRLFDRLAALEAEGEIQVLVVLFPRLDKARTSWHRPDQYDEVQELLRNRGLKVVDVRSEMEARALGSLANLYTDSMHLSKEGHALVAQLLLRELNKMLQ